MLSKLPCEPVPFIDVQPKWESLLEQLLIKEFSFVEFYYVTLKLL
jgi:hypothetical protein